MLKLKTDEIISLYKSEISVPPPKKKNSHSETVAKVSVLKHKTAFKGNEHRNI